MIESTTEDIKYPVFDNVSPARISPLGASDSDPHRRIPSLSSILAKLEPFQNVESYVLEA